MPLQHCDQIVRLFFQHLAIYNNENLHYSIKIWKTFLPNNYLINHQNSRIVKLTKSGHTAAFQMHATRIKINDALS